MVHRRAGRARREDPVEYRLSIIADPRARAVIEKVAAMARWQGGAPGGAGRGRGIAFARYKNLAAYSAVVAELVGRRGDPSASRVVRGRCRPGDQS